MGGKEICKMKCERCDVEMEKRELEPPHTSFGGAHYKKDTNMHYVIAKSVHICPQCGKLEFNIND